MRGKIGRSVFTFAVACVVWLVAPSASHAQWRIKDLNPFNPDAGINKTLVEFDKTRLNAMAPGFRAGRDFTKVYVQNNSDKPIWVAVIDIPFVVVQGNETVIDDPSPDGPWRVHAWWKVEPKDRVHVSNTSNRNVYFFAKNDSGMVWGGDVTHQIPDGNNSPLRVGFRKESFDGTPEEYTVRFDP